MNLGVKNFLSGVLSSFTPTHLISVRHRYYAERIAKGPAVKKFGYKDKISREGILPRLKDAPPVPAPVYIPNNAWTPEKALFGQNDYIDILGGGKLKPSSVSYNVPKWLRGVQGNELQLLLLKQKVLSRTKYQYENPTAWSNMRRRVRYLYRYLNYRTKTSASKQ